MPVENISKQSHQNNLHYRQLYQNNPEPWSYTHRAAEVLRHQYIVRELFTFKQTFEKGLDIGCSLGQLTSLLSPLCSQLYAIDVSEIAVHGAIQFCHSSKIHFSLAQLPGLPFQLESLDLIVAADSIYEFVPEQNRSQAVQDIHKILKPNGMALFTDYIRPEKYLDYLDLIQKNNFKIVKIVPLHDRLWYQFESWFKSIRQWKFSKILLSSIFIAKLFRYPSGLFADQGSMHHLIFVKKA